MSGETLYLLPIVFGFCVFVVSLIYLIGGKSSARNTSKNTDGKTAPYACGEEFPAEELKVDLERFFVFAVFFLIFDVFAFIVATSFSAAGLLPIAYCLIVLTAVLMLLSVRRHR
ncbi:hypothetical protein DRO34_07100 [Candidatus Bathyarchaeota archaeon]|nr:MAG: hypothetical protein DRO34_07100 [Candidatus Bathyarchaeota archaeon]